MCIIETMPRRRKRHQPAKLGSTLTHLFRPSKRNYYRSKLLHPESILYFCLIVLASFSIVRALRFFPSLSSSILGYASNITAEDVLIQTNHQRVNQGLSELKINEKLSQAALAKGQDMFTDQYWSHTSPDGMEPWSFIKESGYVYKAAGENLARDFMDTTEMMEAWMKSPTHRANIVNNKFEEIGIAVINGNLQGFETTLVVQMFGSPTTVANNKAGQQQLLTDSARQEVASVKSATDQETQVLAGSVLLPNPLDNPVLLTPLHLTKAFFLAVIILITATLIYDSFIVRNRQIVMAFNKNLGHLLVLGAVTFILIFFRSGLIQ